MAARGGQEVKNLGDGLMVVFPSAFRAVSCAVAMQQALHRHNEAGEGPPFSVRVGLHVGEPIREEGDYFGASVVVAKRLCDAASGGQVLASELVRALVGTRGEHVFRPLGPLALKGLAEPVPAFAVEWEPLPPEEEEPGATAPPPRPITLPAGLLKATRSPFVGRVDERQHLREAWARSGPGTGGSSLSPASRESARPGCAWRRHWKCWRTGAASSTAAATRRAWCPTSPLSRPSASWPRQAGSGAGSRQTSGGSWPASSLNWGREVPRRRAATPRPATTASSRPCGGPG